MHTFLHEQVIDKNKYFASLLTEADWNDDNVLQEILSCM